MPDDAAPPEMLTVTIDGQTIEVEPGKLLIEAAIESGKYIPHFCWHPRMSPVAKCRMCLVEVEGQRGLPAACTTPCSDGMEVRTKTDLVVKAQEAVLEFLLINHPLDCPVCDRGGECPLQDQTLAFGPGESRFVEEKRHFEKPIPISPLVMLDRERCVLCDRCTRFADEIAGDPLIKFVDRGNRTHVLTFPEKPFSSHFSGNTVEACPVGALTAAPYRFRARPWDLEETESTCSACAVGCRVKVQSASSRVVRLLGVDSGHVNQGWLCDKGRFGFEYLHNSERLTTPLIRDDDELVEATWGEALDLVAAKLSEAALKGREAIGFLGGARSTLESAYAFNRLARVAAGTNNIDAQLGDGIDSEFLVHASRRAVIDDLDSAGAIVLAAPDLKEELPVLYLRARRAAVELGVPVIELGAVAAGMTPYSTLRLAHRPGEATHLLGALATGLGYEGTASIPDSIDRDDFDEALAILRAAGQGIVIVAGRANLAEDEAGKGRAALALAEATDGRVLPVAHRGNLVGALLAGCAPRILPGGSDFEQPAARKKAAAIWGSAGPASPGRDSTAMLASAATGTLDALVLMGADPIGDHPDRSLAIEAFGRASFIVAIDIFRTTSALAADVVLPAATFGEQSGSFVNIEGRITWQNAKIAPPGLARPEWFIVNEISARMGAGTPGGDPEAILADLAAHGGAFEGLESDALKIASRGGGGVMTSPDVDRIAFASSVPDQEVPRFEQYNHRVVASRGMYGNGSVNAHCPSLMNLAASATARICRRDADRLGVSGGDLVRLRGDRGELELPVEVVDGTPEGAVEVHFNRALSNDPASGRIADLIDSGSRFTEVTVETVEVNG